MEGADKGVILFTMGATLDGKVAPTHIMSSFLEAFGKVPQRIIFQYKGNPNALKIPPNVKVVSGWIPQQSVLGNYTHYCINNQMIYDFLGVCVRKS